LNRTNLRKLLGRITRKWPAKVMAVAAAIALMTFHRMSVIETRFFPSPLLVEAGELVPASRYTGVVRVGIRGEAGIISTVFEGDIETFLDVSAFTAEGLYRVPVQVRRTGTAAGGAPLEISVEPAEVVLRLEQRVSRNIPLVPVFRGTLAYGFEAAGHSLIPASVVAEGPRSILEAVPAFETGIIDIEGRNDDFTLSLEIINTDPFVVIRGVEGAEFRGLVRPVAAAEPVLLYEGLPQEAGDEAAPGGLYEEFAPSVAPGVAPPNGAPAELPEVAPSGGGSGVAYYD